MAAGTSPQEFRGLTDEELVTRLRESKEELFNLRFQGATGQRLVADRGFVSMSSTRSPMPQEFASSCALSLLVRRTTLP